ncbi:predicted ORF [Xanthomonas phage XacN1]|nr:predicted ORF [Xanthomonas phage XacN1]BBA65690.1 predicted ORF [Xanthomonas phage XacN1]
MTYTVQYADKSRLPTLVAAYQLVDQALKGLAITKDCAVTLNRFYYDNEFFLFNFSVTLKGTKPCMYLLSIPNDSAMGMMGWTIRSNKWNGQREPIDSPALSFGHFIRKTDHDKNKKKK